MDSDGNGIGDLPGITSKIDYLQSLGITALWLNPIYVSGWQDGGYDVIDFYKVDPRFGTNTDLVHLADALHQRGMKLCLDLVAGHTSDKNEWFLQSKSGKDLRYSDYYIWTDEITDAEKEQIKRRYEAPDPSASTIGRFVEANAPRAKYYEKNFYESQPALNYGYANPDPTHPWEQPVTAPGPRATRQELKSIMEFWFSKGVDGFRVDLASSLVKNDPDKKEVSKLWQEMRQWRDQNFPDRALIAEWFNPEQSLPAGFDIDFYRIGGRGASAINLFRLNTTNTYGGGNMPIKVSKLTHIYDEGMPTEQVALEDVSFTVEDGEILGIIGHTGSGKSTLLQHLDGLLKPNSGSILIGDVDITKPGVSLVDIRKRVGLVFQYPEYQLFEETVEKDVAYGPGNLGLSQEEISERVREAITLVGLDFDTVKDRSPFELSGGQKRAVAIAGVIAMRPQVLILDEPTAGLDPKTHDDILNAMAEQQLWQLPLYEQTEALFSLLNVDRMEQQSAYLCAFYDQVMAFSADRGSDTDAFLSAWDEDICGKTIQSPEDDGIRIISIHKSKGLEFPCVLIPFCDWRLEQNDVLWCTPTEEPFNQLPLAPISYSQSGMTGTIYDNDYKEEHQQNIVDNLNLLYVAFTRAGSELYVYGKRKASTNIRSALIEQVLPEVEKQLRPTPDRLSPSPSLKGGEEIPGEAVITGTEDEKAPLVFEYGKRWMVDGGVLMENTPSSDNSQSTIHHQPSTINNPFLQPSTPVKVDIEAFPVKASFKQSNQSREFLGNDYGEEDTQQAEYIKLGNVLHRVLASISSTDDIDDALTQMEQDGVLFGEGELTRQRLTQLIRRRVESPRVAEWFEPGRWQLFNECAILSIDPESGRVMKRRPDRVMTDGQQTIVVDFKFGHDCTDYHEQVQRYMGLLSDMGHQNVKGYLWLVYKNEIIEV